MTGRPDSETTDFLVLGGGTSGCVVAARLLAAGHRVTLIEAGPDYGSLIDGSWPRELLDAAALPLDSHDWGYCGVGAGGQPLRYERARVLGGCSAHNGCTQTAGWAGDYDEWAAQGSVGWDAASLSEDFEHAMDALRLRFYSEEEIQPFHRAFIDSSVDAGLNYQHDLHQLDGAQGVGCAPVNVVDGMRMNTAFAFLDAWRSSPELTVIDRAHVETVLIQGGTVAAVGARYRRDGQLHVARADRVVLCAGAYGSPEILLRSGIGPAGHLSDLGIPNAVHLPGVGENLQEHPAVHLEYAGSAELASALADFAATQWLPEEQTVVKLRSPHADGPFDLHVYPWIEPDADLEHGWRAVFPVSQLRPRSRGTVRLRSADPDAAAVVDPGFLSDPGAADLGSLRFGLNWITTNIVEGTMSRFLGHALHDLAQYRDSEVDEWIRRHHTHYWHPAGSCRMGAETDPMSVVRHDGSVIGVEGLTIADASIFPDIPRATPALPVVVVAERIARFLLDGHR
ncbi:GMC family oxidoreductase [Agromyces neolithicus]|uniref:GMC family oxidoreductase n=1 Tax=Agromyces neolithicus TaxID=269420 RepID=A0ABP4YD68_9MICO